MIATVLLCASQASAQEVTFPTTESECGYVAATGGGAVAVTALDVVRAKGVGCSKARRVARRCISVDRVRDWRATAVEYTMKLKRHGDRVAFRIASGPIPDCVHEKGLGTTRDANTFGPFEEPEGYPDKLPPPFKITYQWSTPVNTYRAYIRDAAVSTVDIRGYARNLNGAMASVWFQYGRTRDFASAIETAKVPPPTGTGDAPLPFDAHLTHLQAKTRYYWRAVANVDNASGGVTTVYGATGSFVTKPYATIKDPSRPCKSEPGGYIGEPFQLTESLAIVCSGTRKFSRDACAPACNNLYHGTLSCDKDFPRNLNAGSWSFSIPKIGYPVSVNELASYWRSDDSNKFWMFPGYNKNSSGGDVGPVPGWQDWDVAQWAYPFTSTSTTVDFWINCTEKWGGVIDGSSLAQGEGNDLASMAPPGVPQDLTAKKAADGGVDGAWKAPANASPSGIAGYYFTAVGYKPGEPKIFADGWSTPVTSTGLSGHIDPGRVTAIKKSMPSNYDLYVVVGAISREGSISSPAALRWN